MNLIAGIDGGGTRTTVRCCDMQGTPLSEAHFGPLNLNSIGESQFRKLMGDIAGFLMRQGHCESLCIGAAGVSSPTLQPLLEDVLAPFPIGRWQLVGDHVIAHAGALSGDDGLIVIAGTGSICYGRTRSGREIRLGGWGHLIGDEGSGYALGRDALKAVAKALDGYGETTCLVPLLAQERGLSTRAEIIGYAYGGDKAQIAALSPLVDRAAREGDSVAISIIRENACALAALAAAAHRQLGLAQAKIAPLGGLLQHPTCLREAFIQALHLADASLHCTEPLGDACAGAVLLAKKH